MKSGKPGRKRGRGRRTKEGVECVTVKMEGCRRDSPHVQQKPPRKDWPNMEGPEINTKAASSIGRGILMVRHKRAGGGALAWW